MNDVKVIVAGSRSITDRHVVETAMVESGFRITEVVCGLARGVDTVGKEIAEYVQIPVVEFPADWERHGRGAGKIRNVEMARYADALIAVWDGESKGTLHMINVAKKFGLKIYVMIQEVSVAGSVRPNR